MQVPVEKYTACDATFFNFLKPPVPVPVSVKTSTARAEATFGAFKTAGASAGAC